jgi:hypothetical protein
MHAARCGLASHLSHITVSLIHRGCESWTPPAPAASYRTDENQNKLSSTTPDCFALVRKSSSLVGSPISSDETVDDMKDPATQPAF